MPRPAPPALAPLSTLEAIKAERCRRSFWEFIQEFWSEIPGAGQLVPNWHMQFLANELQTVAERVMAGLPRLYDLIVNVPFGTSKSSISSILFQCWVWTRMPEARFICATHTDRLVTIFGSKIRTILSAEKYRRWFPEIQLKRDSDGWFSNTKGGERVACTVGGVTPMGMHGHYCLPYESSIMTDRGILPIGRIVEERLNARVLGFNHKTGRLCWQHTTDWMKSPGGPVDRLKLSDGSYLELTQSHPVFVVGKGYVPASRVSVGDEVVHVRKLSKMRERDSGPEVVWRIGKDKNLLLRNLLLYSSERNGGHYFLPNLWNAVQQWYRRAQEREPQILLGDLLQRAQASQTETSSGRVLPKLWAATLPLAIWEGKQILRQSLQREACRQKEVRRGPKGWYVPLPDLRERILGGTTGLQEAAKVLLPGVCQLCRKGGKSPPLGEEKRGPLLDLRKAGSTNRASNCPSEKTLLLSQMRFGGEERTEFLPLRSQSVGSLPQLWQTSREKSQSSVRAENSLLRGMCGRNTIEKNVWSREHQLDARSLSRALHGDVPSGTEGNSEEGRRLLLSLWEEREEGKTVGASYRLGQKQRLRGESCHALSELPLQTTREDRVEGAYGSATVLEIERGVRIPHAVYNITTSPNHNYFAEGILVHNCIVDDPIDPEGVRSELEIDTAGRFMTEVLPGRLTNKEVSVTILVMQRLDPRDPTNVLLEFSKREGAYPVKRICLPGELTDDVHPPLSVLREMFPHAYGEDGLLDPNRLNRRVLESFKARGQFFYSSQVLQNPVPRGGGRFNREWFDQIVRAAPYASTRVRVWDRAATLNGGCYTAGVLMARDAEGRLYVEDVIHGQWEPNQRNDIIVAAAQRDRLKYGPKYEPTVVIEAERGSTGKESFQHLARRLLGFRIQEVLPQGNKDVRAEPWADQLAAKNVWLVNSGKWDVDGFISEHLLFRPDVTSKRLGGQKDRVDASAHAANWLATKTPLGKFTALPLRRFSGKYFQRKIVCAPPDLVSTLQIDDHPTLLVAFVPPAAPNSAAPPANYWYSGAGEAARGEGTEDDEIPAPPLAVGEVRTWEASSGLPPLPVLGHRMTKCLGSVAVACLDLDPAEHQATWDDLVEGYGVPAQRLLLSREQGKKLWGFLMKKFDPPWEIAVVTGEGNIPHSAAKAIAAGLGLRENEAIYDAEAAGLDGDGALLDRPVSSTYLYDMIKFTRNMVV